MSPFSQCVARKIRSKRIELGLKQQELGLLMGCSVQLIQHYEKEFCQMPIGLLSEFAGLCRLPIDWFFLEENEILVYVTLL